VIVAFSSKTDLPMAWETLLAVAVTLLTLVLLIRLLLAPDGGLDDGFFAVLGGTVLTVLAGWRSVAREY
jgi:multisubunit Na+/H+ antiporter MnhB subunit